MDATQGLIVALWESVSFGSLAWTALLGTLSGGILGGVSAWQLQRRGWLGRRNRWHHLLLKLYVVLLPAAGMWLGLQGGLMYGLAQQVHAQIDRSAPLVQAAADAYVQDFQTYLARVDIDAMKAQETSVQGLIGAMVRDYLVRHPLLPALSPDGEEASLWQQAGAALMDPFRESLISRMLTQTVVDQVADISQLDKKMLTQLTRVKLGQLLQADTLLGLVKQQIDAFMFGLYVGVGLQLGLLLALVVVELGLSRFWGQLRGPQRAPRERARPPVPLAGQDL